MPQTPPSTGSSRSSTRSKSDADADVEDASSNRGISTMASPVPQRNTAAKRRHSRSIRDDIVPSVVRQQKILQEPPSRSQMPNNGSTITNDRQSCFPLLERGLRSSLELEQIAEYIENLEQDQKTLQRRDAGSQYHARQLERANDQLQSRIAELESRLAFHEKKQWRDATIEDRVLEMQYRGRERLFGKHPDGCADSEGHARPPGQIGRTSAESHVVMPLSVPTDGGSEVSRFSLDLPIQSTQGLSFNADRQVDPFDETSDGVPNHTSSASNFSPNSAVPSIDTECIDDLMSKLFTHWGSLTSPAIPAVNATSSSFANDYSRFRPAHHRRTSSAANAATARRFSHRMSTLLPQSASYPSASDPRGWNSSSRIGAVSGRISEEAEPEHEPSTIRGDSGMAGNPRANLEGDDVAGSMRDSLDMVRPSPPRKLVISGVEMRMTAFKDERNANVRLVR